MRGRRFGFVLRRFFVHDRRSFRFNPLLPFVFGPSPSIITLSALVWLNTGISAVAAPFRDLKIPFIQPDGARIEVIATGDEFYAVFETPAGFTAIFDPVMKAYCFAVRAPDGQLASTGQQVHLADPVMLGLGPHLRMTDDARTQQVAALWQRWEAATQIGKRWRERKAELHEYGVRAKGLGPQPAPPSFTTTGAKLGLTLLVDFDDEPATVPRSEIAAFCNADAYTGFGNNGSVKQYYHDNSNNLLTYSNVVTVYIRIPNSLHPKNWYNDPTLDCGAQGNLLVRDAIAILKAMPNYYAEILPTFANLTVDGTNQVVACNVLYAGANGGVWNKGLWPNFWSLQNVGAQELSPGGKKVWTYQISNIGASLEIGPFCHETGHMLCGFPDIYDYDSDPIASAGGAGSFCLMNSGSYGGNPGQICAYLKRAAGWATTTELNSASVLTASLSAAAGTDFNHFYRYQKSGVPTEYFLLECRYAIGRDASLPASGVAIWHIDELGDHNNQSLLPNTNHNNYEVTLVQADNLWDFESNSNIGDANDLYSSQNKATAYSNEFSDVSAPNAHWWDGSASGANFHDFTAPATKMYIEVGRTNAPPQILVQPRSQTVIVCHPASFSTSAQGYPALRYQWYFNGTPIDGATTSTCSIPSVDFTNQGNYFAVATNIVGSAASETAVLKVLAPISLSQALDTTNLEWSTGGGNPWEGTIDTTHDGIDAAVSGPIPDSQQSWMQTTITNGSGTLAFWWKVDSESGSDLLFFDLDGVPSGSISGQVGWEQRKCAIPPGTHVARWRYSKDESRASGRDSGWVDQVAFTPGVVVPAPSLAEALDAPYLVWTTGGAAAWSGETSTVHDGTDAVQSGAISNDQGAWLETALNGSGTLSFWWKVSSEKDYDWLEFQVDGAVTDRLSGEVDWNQQTFRLSAGAHELRWVYVKDFSQSLGQDRGWVDQVVFVPEVVLAPEIVAVTNLANGQFQFDVQGSVGASYLVLGSIDLVAWTPLVTNTAPFTFADDQAALRPHRFYRAQSAP